MTKSSCEEMGLLPLLGTNSVTGVGVNLEGLADLTVGMRRQSLVGRPALGLLVAGGLAG